MTRVLIVEDEPILRQGIVSLVDWAGIGCEVCGDCANGIEASNFLGRTPVDLVISDIKMPGKDGLELARHIKETYPQTMVVLLTAYSEFEYAQAALRFGVDDYILKNDFIHTLPKAVKALLDRKPVEKLPAARTPFQGKLSLRLAFQGILDGSIQKEGDIAGIVSAYGVHLDGFHILFLDINGPAGGEVKQRSFLSIQPVLKLVTSTLQDYPHFSVTVSPYEVYFVVGSGQKDGGLSHLMGRCRQMTQMLSDYTQYQVAISVSGFHTSLTQLKTAAEEARLAAQGIWEYGQIQAYSEESVPEVSSRSPNLNAACDSLFSCLTSEGEDQLQSCINRIFTSFGPHCPLEKFQLDMTFLATLCCQRLQPYVVEQQVSQQLQSDAVAGIMGRRTPYGVKMEFSRMCHAIGAFFSSAGSANRLVMQTDAFIKENYALAIKLDDIAGMLHVNSSYLSRIYKKETGSSLVTSLNRYRVERAKELLAGEKYRVAEVAAMVGIDDPAYFTKVFAKFTGHTPRQKQTEKKKKERSGV